MRSPLSIVIVNYRGARDTLECLRSLDAVTYENFSVFVVENGSGDDSLDVISAFHPQHYILHSMPSAENRGFSGGNNIALRHIIEHSSPTDPGYVLLLNNDTVVAPDFLDVLMNAAEHHPEYGILGPKIHFFGSKTIWFIGGKLRQCGTKGIHVHYQAEDRGQFDTADILPTDFVTGCALLMPLALLHRVGLMREDYFLYFEDVEWNMRVRRYGSRIGVVPGAVIEHKVSRSTDPTSFAYIYYHTRNGLDSGFRQGKGLVKVCVLVIALWTVVKQYAKMPVKRDHKWERAILAGVRDFFYHRLGKLA
jgi:GT2 family glycosyltransferase